MSEEKSPIRGTVYTCTTLHAAAESFEKDLPFQIAIVITADGIRLTARIEGERVAIGDRVQKSGERQGISIFTRDSTQAPTEPGTQVTGRQPPPAVSATSVTSRQPA